MSDLSYSEKGEQWFADEGPFAGQIQTYWGDWGCASEVAPLRAVMLRRPGAEIAAATRERLSGLCLQPLPRGLARIRDVAAINRFMRRHNAARTRQP